MDEQLLKSAVQSIEMPSGMKERIIAGCKDGGEKPIGTPKNRFSYRHIAAAACACLTVAALAGVGIWQMGTFSGESIDPPYGITEDVINVITLDADDLPSDADNVSEEEKVHLSDLQLNEYFGMDVSVLNRLYAIPADMHYKPYGWAAYPYFYVKGGEAGDIFTDTYFDHWTATYDNAAENDHAPVNLRNITVTLSLLEMPQHVEKLWEEPAMLSTIGGRQAAIGCLTEYGADTYIAQFTSEDGSIKISVRGYRVELEELHKFIADVVEQTGEQPYGDVIHVIPIYDDDGDTIESAFKDGYSGDVSFGDYVMMTEEEISEYYGIDTGFLFSELGIYPTVYNDILYGGGYGVYRADGEVYYDTNPFIYGENEEISVYISKLGIPYSIPKLWGDSEMLSTISGITAAVGIREGWESKQYRVEFAMEQYGLYFNVWCDYDMISSVVKEIRYRCDSAFAWGVPAPDPELKKQQLEQSLRAALMAFDCVYDAAVILNISEESGYVISDSKAESSAAVTLSLKSELTAEQIDGMYDLVANYVPGLKRENITITDRNGRQLFAVYDEDGSAKLIWPTDGGYISEWGYWDGGYSGHMGIDIAGIEQGDPVYAGADGVVTYAGWDDDMGNYVEIDHPDLGITSCYAHNSTLYVSVGQQVAQGERIADAGATGVAYGAHIHLAVKVDGENVNPKDYLSHLSEVDVINVIQMGPEPITPEDIRRPEADLVEMTPEELNEYFGMDVFPQVPDDMYWWYEPRITDVIGVCRSEGGTGEVYLDYNYLVYNGDFGDNWDRGMCVYFMKGRIPGQLEKLLWGDPAKLSVINGVTVAIGIDDDGRYYAEFMTGNVGFHLQGSINGGLSLDEWVGIVRSYLERPYEQDARPQASPLTLDKLREICRSYAKLSWSDFEQFACIETGTDYVIRRYDIEGSYTLDISGSLDDSPENMYFSFNHAAQSERIDIRTQDIDEYLPYYQDRINKTHESGEKESSFASLELYENQVRNAYSEYEDIPFGENHLPAQQAIEAAEAQAAQAAIAYAAIGKGRTLPYAAVPDTVNVIPVSESAAAANWASSIYMDNSGFSLHSVTENHYDKLFSQLEDFYGVNVLPEAPYYMERQNDSYGFYYDESGEVYLDVNVIRYVSNDHFHVYRDGSYVNLTLTVEVMKYGIPDFSPEFWSSPALLSDINGVTVAIGQVNEYDYAAEFMVGDVGFHITSENLSLEQLTGVISSLTAQ